MICSATGLIAVAAGTAGVGCGGGTTNGALAIGWAPSSGVP